MISPSQTSLTFSVTLLKFAEEMEKIGVLHSDKAEDVSTSSSFRQFKIEHFHLDLSVDFDKKTISCTETLRLKCIQEQQSEVLLDIHPSLHFQDVSFCQGSDDSEWKKAEYLTRDFSSYGTTLVVKFPSPWKADEKFQLAIKYTATDGPGVRIPSGHFIH